MIKFKMDLPPISCPPICLLTLSGLHSAQHRGIPIYHPHQGHGPQAPELGEPLNQVIENRTATFHVPAANDLHSFPFKSQFSLYVSRFKCCPQEPGLNLELSGQKKIRKLILFQKQVQGGVQPHFLPHHFILTGELTSK